MEFPLKECPHCHTGDEMIQESEHLFLCQYCFALFSVIPFNLGGTDYLRVTHYISGVSQRVPIT